MRKKLSLSFVRLKCEAINETEIAEDLPLDILELSDSEVAKGNSGESRALSHAFTSVHHIDILETVHIVVGCHESIEQEELSNDVCDVEDFDAKV